MRAAETLRASLLADSSGAAAFDVAVNRLATCANRYRLNVGAPRNPAWRRPARLALSACVGYTRAERLLLAAVGNEGGGLLLPGKRCPVESRSEDDPSERGARAHVRLEPAAAASRRPERQEQDRSALQPRRDSDRAQAGRDPMWSRADWDNVLAQFNAWEPGSDPAGFVGSTSFSHSANLGRRRASSSIGSRTGRSTRRDSDADELASAVQILSHEIQHLVANGSEAETECYGMQALERVARGLGAPARTHASSRCASGSTAIRRTTPFTTRSSARTAGRSTRTRRRPAGPSEC